MTTTESGRLHIRRAETTLSRTAAGFSIAAAVTLVINAILTIVKDAWEPLHDFMQKLMGHHWTTHGAVILAVFFVLGWSLSKNDTIARLSDATLIGPVAAGALINGAAIALWFMLF
ncbi:hypothetical protein ACFFWD_08820 [Bradyrhizobium erythrophlei]|uniref:hypothetical protein n=1 Tax=Bradyrhizobium erythrophlei TaxID=1437360 RepID=UPI0035E894EC